MKPGDLVYFSSKHLAYDFEQLRGQYGLLLEYVEIGGREGQKYKVWKTLWGEKKVNCLGTRYIIGRNKWTLRLDSL